MATEKRLIDANECYELADHCYSSFYHHVADLPILRNLLNNCPTVDAVEVVHGHWDEIPNKYMSVSAKNGSYSGHATSCSFCHEVNPNVFKTNYCPNCGAKMDGDGNG